MKSISSLNIKQLRKRFPLPKGVKNKECTREELAQSMDVSTLTIDSWRRKGMPCAKVGGRGRAYAYDYADVFAWYKAWKSGELDGDDVNSDDSMLMKEHLSGGGTKPASSSTLSDRRLKAAKADMEMNKAAVMRRMLIPSGEVDALVGRLLGYCQKGISPLPDRLERELGLNATEVQIAVDITDDILNGIWKIIEEAELKPLTATGEVIEDGA